MQADEGLGLTFVLTLARLFAAASRGDKVIITRGRQAEVGTPLAV